jgi:hypothetical protein
MYPYKRSKERAKIQKIMKSVTRWMEIRGIKMRNPIPMISISIARFSFLTGKLRTGAGPTPCESVCFKINSFFPLSSFGEENGNTHPSCIDWRCTEINRKKSRQG